MRPCAYEAGQDTAPWALATVVLRNIVSPLSHALLAQYCNILGTNTVGECSAVSGGMGLPIMCQPVSCPSRLSPRRPRSDCPRLPRPADRQWRSLAACLCRNLSQINTQHSVHYRCCPPLGILQTTALPRRATTFKAGTRPRARSPMATACCPTAPPSQLPWGAALGQS